MEEKNIQEQINEVNQKLDRLLEYVEFQNRKREEFDDLVEDVTIVAKDAVKQSVILLDKAQVDLDSCSISSLVMKIVQNLDTFHEMLNMMESARDFMKDVTPILHQVGLDAVNKMNEMDQKGYFLYLSALTSLMDKWIQVFTADDLRKMENNLETVAALIRNLANPELINSLNNMTRTFSEVKMDDKIDDRSLWKIFLQMKSPEVRKSISYSLRLVQAMNK